MTTELWMLTATAVWSWVLIMVAATPGLLTNGLGWGLGNRETPPPSTGWPARANRASANMLENLPLFAILVLVAHVSGQSDAMSATGSQIFLGGRVAHGVIYIAGVPGLRTLAWAVSIVGMAMVGASILR